jgi:hypothetical protein
MIIIFNYHSGANGLRAEKNQKFKNLGSSSSSPADAANHTSSSSHAAGDDICHHHHFSVFPVLLEGDGWNDDGYKGPSQEIDNFFSGAVTNKDDDGSGLEPFLQGLPGKSREKIL